VHNGQQNTHADFSSGETTDGFYFLIHKSQHKPKGKKRKGKGITTEPENRHVRKPSNRSVTLKTVLER
jgi:hypothetical protein